MKLQINECNKIKKAFELKVHYIDGDGYYPDGKGGQLGDRGNIGQAKVLEVKKDSIIVDRELSPEVYEYTVDIERQIDIAAQHTAEHLISGIAFRDYGLQNVGFRMAEEYTTVDLASADISVDVIEEIESKVNKYIREGIAVTDFTISREEADKRVELRKDISQKVEGDVRFIDIHDVDICACGGFHVKNTSEIQILKFINSEKVKGNHTRLYFLCGERAIADYKNKNTIVKEANKLFSSKDHQIIGFIESNLKEKRSLESKLKDLSADYAKLLSSKLMESAKSIKENKVIYYPANDDVANSLHRFIADNTILIFGENGQHSILSKQINCKDFVAVLKEKYEVKGGGNPVRGSFKGGITETEIFTALEEFIL